MWYYVDIGDRHKFNHERGGKMYCRECGNQIPDNSIRCPDCDTKTGEGFDFCNYCGQYTTEKMVHCRHCGAKLNTIVPQKVLKERALDIQKRVKFAKKMNKILKFICVGSVALMALLILILVFRPEPSNIPDPRKSDELLRVGNTYYYDSSYVSKEVAEYWAQGRALISYIVCSLFVFIVSLVNKFVWKKKYKKLVVALKEAKNVL